MNAQLFYALQIASSFSVVPAIILAFLYSRPTDFKVRIFLFFLVAGFITDLAGWYFYLNTNWEANARLQNFYILIESVFLLWFVSLFITNYLLHKVFSKLWLIAIPVWGLTVYLGKDAITSYKVASQVIIAMTTSFCLLQWVEKDQQLTKQITFWLLLGVFFYNFCTFFFMSLLASQTGSNLWYMHNITNIFTNLLYAWGYFQCRHQTSIAH